MNPEAARHAGLLFIFVFGAAAIFFTGIILTSREDTASSSSFTLFDYVTWKFKARIEGGAIAVAVILFGLVVFSFW